MKSNSNGNGHATGASAPLVLNTVMTPWDWLGSRDEHFVQFYEKDDFLIDSLCRFVTEGLQASETVVVAATDEHLNALNRRLSQQGLDVVAAITTGNYVPLSAEATLAEIKSDGRLSAERARELIGNTVLQTLVSGRRLRVFGELVELLCAEGEIEAAIELENLWNEVKLTQPFSLFCAYSIQGLTQQSITDVCRTHAHVIPAESFTTLPSSDSQARAIAVLQQKAQRLESEMEERLRAEENLRLAKEQLESQVAELGQLVAGEQSARAEAETANRMKDEFLATVSHELRTPLNAIIGWTHMLRRGRLDDETESRALETIERNAKAQAQLVEDILDVSRMISGKLRLQKAPVDLVSVITGAVDSVQLAATSKNIEVHISLETGAQYVRGDANRLQQIVWNLLSNAIKFTDDGGRVEVGVERRNSQIVITVTDTGLGIRKEFLPHVFDRFRQEDGASTRRHSGLGLGLALVKHLVELHGGRVSVASEGEGRGASFTVELPLAPENRMKAESGPPALVFSTGRLKGRRILLVDHDSEVVRVLSMKLAELAAELLVAASTEEAGDILSQYEPDVVVVDLGATGTKGHSLVREIKSYAERVGKLIPVVALTPEVRVEDRVRALFDGFDIFVPKPFEADELINAISNLTN
ncbi:MAG TPA: ATP-binding protein [Pyrinomonadaceae bacterium]|nr:ATP-binding protein [Pyrinomonadaceae bacterium]